MLTQAAQDYLKAIYKLQNGREPLDSVNTSMLAQTMDVAAASVTNMVKKLAEMKLLEHTPYRGVELTPAGTAIALEVIRHHRLLELYLADALGYRWDQVDAEADRLEHVISEEFEDRIDRAMGHPTRDPHGAPIPAKDGSIESVRHACLSEIEEGRTVVINQVSDENAEMLRYMASLGLRPGAVVRVRKRAPFNGPLLIHVEPGEDQPLGQEVAQNIYVTPVAEPA